MAEISMGNIGESFAPSDDNFNTNFVKLFYDTVANAFLLRNTLTGALVASIGQFQLPVVVAALAQADLATETYTDYGVGKVIMVTAYAGTATGCTIVKTSTSGGDYTDWRILASDDVADTGAISENPA